jgi:hypothetical protein
MLYSMADIRITDITIRLDPWETTQTPDSLENNRTLKPTSSSSTGNPGVHGVRKAPADYREIYYVLQNTPMKSFEMSMYLGVRGSTADAIGTETVANTAR